MIWAHTWFVIIVGVLLGLIRIVQIVNGPSQRITGARANLNQRGESE